MALDRSRWARMLACQRWRHRLLCVLLSFGLSQATLAEELYVLAYQNPGTLDPLLEVFASETGIDVRVEYLSANDLKQTLIDGSTSADVIFTLEAKRLADLVSADVLAPVASDSLTKAVPVHFRHPDNLWFAIAKWSRSVYYAKARVDPSHITSYQSLTAPRWRGRICVRTSNKIYVQSLLASMIAAEGEADARRFAEGLVANLARPPSDLDMAQLQGVFEGACDITLANSYYYERLLAQRYDPLVPAAGKAAGELLAEVKPLAVNQDGRGVHMNVSAVAMAKRATHPAAALRLMEYALTPLAQRLLTQPGRELPIVDSVRAGASTQLFGDFREDNLPLAELAEHYATAERIARESGWTWK